MKIHIVNQADPESVTLPTWATMARVFKVMAVEADFPDNGSMPPIVFDNVPPAARA